MWLYSLVGDDNEPSSTTLHKNGLASDDFSNKNKSNPGEWNPSDKKLYIRSTFSAVSTYRIEAKA